MDSLKIDNWWIICAGTWWYLFHIYWQNSPIHCFYCVL